MQAVGRIKEVWTYPVSSVGGQKQERLVVAPGGIAEDRRFALFDAETGLAAAPEREPRWRPALFMEANSSSATAMPQLHFPGGERFWLDDPTLNAKLEAYFGFSVRVGYYASKAVHADIRFPITSNRYEPAALHVVTTSSLAALGAILGSSELDARRFRPSILIDTDGMEGFIENDWVGNLLFVGNNPISVTEPARRCGMTMIAQPGLEENPDILRSIMRHNKRHLGVYAEVGQEITLRPGDLVYAET
ncbi:MOSC domain-containing protein [Peteryoungia ipomoeae]|nr:MOSC N-terminal beta barrel domain-containing protein [Peteryoungia ipomoeae]